MNSTGFLRDMFNPHSDNSQTVSSAEMDYWSDRREERRLLLEELEKRLQEGKPQN